MIDQLYRILDLFDSSSLSVWGPFGLLILCGLGLPVPEDIILVAAGFMGADNGKALLPIIVLMYVGIVIGDFIIYSVGRVFGRRVLGTRVGRYVITEDRLVKAEGLFHQYGRGVVFVGRFLPGLRAPVFFSAGLLRYSISNFLIMDGLAALVSAPFFVWLGHWAFERYSENMDMLEKTLGKTKIFFGLGSLLAALVVFYLIRQRSRIKNASS